MKLRTLSALVALAAIVAAAFPVRPADAQSAPARAIVPTMPPSPLLPAVPTVAPGYQAPDVAPTAANIVGVVEQPFVGITLSDAVGMALLKNPNLAISEGNLQIASYQILQVKGAFDVRFMLQPSAQHYIQPPQNPFFAGPGYSNIVQTQTGIQGGFEGQTENGEKYSLTLGQERTTNNTSINTFNPTYGTALNLTLTQPLLKNAGMNDLKRNYKLSIVNQDSTTAQTLIDVSNALTQVEESYWDLVSAWRNVAIQEDALREAIAQQQSNVRLAKKGAAAPIDAVESATQVAIFQDNVFSAVQNVSSLQNALKGLILSNPGDPIWRANLVPTTSVLDLPPAPTLPDLVAAALQGRPEVRQALDAQHQADINTAYAKNQRLPQADLNINATSNGFAGMPIPLPGILQALIGTATPPPITQGGQAQSYNNLWHYKYPAYTVGVQITQPIGSNTARGLMGEARQQEYIAAVERNGVAERIVYEARNALQAYQSSLSRLYAARYARKAAEQVYASELRKFHNGESTTFLVLQRQVELNQDRGRELLAQTDLDKSIVEIQRTSGAILTTNGVNLNTLGSEALK